MIHKINTINTYTQDLRSNIFLAGAIKSYGGSHANFFHGNLVVLEVEGRPGAARRERGFGSGESLPVCDCESG